MAFNYVLQQQEIVSGKTNILGLYMHRYKIMEGLSYTYSSTLAKMPKEDFVKTVLMEDQCFHGNTSFSLIFNDEEGEMKIQPVSWNEIEIQGMNGQTFIDKVKKEHEQNKRKK